MNFIEIYNQFEKASKENFPIKYCTKQNERESDVYDSDIPFMCLVIDRRFDNCWNLMILYPYICKETESQITFGWVDRSGNIFCNIENSTQLWDEFVVGFKEYDASCNKELWNAFIKKINDQYDN